MNGKRANQPREVRIQFTREKDYRVFYASGIYGGLTPSGELWMDFFIDRATPSDYEVVEVDESGKEVGRRRGRLGAEFTRYLQCAIIIDPEKIPKIVDWLEQKYELYLQGKQASQKQESPEQGGDKHAEA